MGEHNIFQKIVRYEQSVRISMLVRAPSLGGGRRIGGRYSHIDTVPTVLDMLGIELQRVYRRQALPMCSEVTRR